MNLDRYLVPFAAAAAWVGLFRGFENARCEKWADGEPHAAEGEHLSKVLLDKVAEASQFDAGFDEAALRAVAVLTWIEERWEEYKAGPPARLPAVLQRGVVVWTWLRTRVPLLLLPEGGLSMQYAAALGKALDGVEPLGASGTGLKAHREAWLGSALASFPGVGLSYLRDLEEEGPQGTHDKVVRAVMRALDHEFRGWPLSPGSGRRAPRERKLTT